MKQWRERPRRVKIEGELATLKTTPNAARARRHHVLKEHAWIAVAVEIFRR
jgi:hypothetical protein